MRRLAALRESRRRARAERDAMGEDLARRNEELADLAAHLQRTREDERGKLARELHDELGAVLTAAKLDLAWLAARLRDDEAVSERLVSLRGLLDAGIDLKRRIVEDLRPSLLTNLGLLPALEALAAEHRRRFHGPVRVRLDARVRLPEDAALGLYRIAQEALTNILRHAGARAIDLELALRDGRVCLRVVDDGTGFDTAAGPHGGHGLAGMRQRMLAMRGDLRVESEPGRGTRVVATLPVPAAD